MHKSILAAMAALAVVAADQAIAGPVNHMRDRVRQWEIRMLENAVGKARAAELLAPQADAEIIGGATAQPGAWPWQVALLQSDIANNFNAQFCGGTLVDESFVVTAAHCVTESSGRVSPRSTIRVLTGTQSLAQNSGGVRRRIAEIIRHPQYDDDSSDYDIAVIRLSTPATGITVARLLNAKQETSLAWTGDPSFVTGWGNLSRNGSNFPTDLQEVEVPIVERSNCNDGNSYDGLITQRMICAGLTAGGKDSCQGDSGGPLIVRDAQGRWQTLAGVVSWGFGCAARNLYGVYARVAVLSGWVRRTMASRRSESVAVDETTSCTDLRGSSQSACLDGLSLAPK